MLSVLSCLATLALARTRVVHRLHGPFSAAAEAINHFKVGQTLLDLAFERSHEATGSFASEAA